MLSHIIAQVPGVEEVIDSAARSGWEAVALVTVVIAVGVFIWRLTWYTWRKFFGDPDKGTPGIVDDWIAEEKRWRGGLTERLEAQASQLGAQAVQCGLHNETVKGLAGILAEQKIVSLASEKSLAASNSHLARLVELHEPRGSIGAAAQQISDNAASLSDLKSAGCHLCDLLEALAKVEWPNSAASVAAHCVKIREEIGKQT